MRDHDLPPAVRHHLHRLDDFDFGPTEPEPGRCLAPTAVIDSDHPTIQATAARLTAGKASEIAKAHAIFEFARDRIVYDIAPDLADRDAWRASATLQRGGGFCQQKAVLLVALARAAGIAAGTGFQHLRDFKLVGTRFEAHLPGGIILLHGLGWLHLGGAWHKVDPSLERELCARRGYRLAELSAQGDAELPATDLGGQPHFEVLADVGPFADLPQPVSALFVGMRETWAEIRTLALRTGATM